MLGLKNALKGVQYANPQLGERLYELCRKATSRHIDRPDEIINQQVVYMINSDMHAYGAARDAVTCLKRRLQMDHPQKQYLAIILTSKVLQECHAAIGPYQGELLQEVAYILRTQHANSPAAARTRQAAMDALRHFGSGGVDAYRQARQQGVGVAPGMPVPQRDPAAVAAERESLLDEVHRLVEQAGTSTELLNELILNKSEAAPGEPDESSALRKELLSDVAELRRLLDGYMSQLAGLTGADAEGTMKKALEAVDQLDAALTLEKDVDAELKDLKEKGQLPTTATGAAAAGALPPPDAGGASSSSSAAAAAAAAAGGGAAATAAAAAAKMQSMNLIDLDDEPPPAAAAAALPAAADPFGMGPPGHTATGPQDPFAPVVPAAAAAGAPPPGFSDPFAAAAAGGPAGAAVVPFPPVAPAADAADPFAALAAAPVGSSGGVAAGSSAAAGFDEPPAFGAAAAAAAAAAPFPPVPTTAGPPPPGAAPAAAGGLAPPAASAGGAADPFADAAPAWGAAAPAAPAAAAAGVSGRPSTGGGFDSLAAAGAPAAAAAAGPPSSGGVAAAPAAAAVQAPQQQQQQLMAAAGSSGGGVGPYGMMQPVAPAPYGAPTAAGGLGPAVGSSGGSAGMGPYGAAAAGLPYGMAPAQYGAPAAAGGMTGGPYGPYGGMPPGGYSGGYGGGYGMQMGGQMPPGAGGGMYPGVPGGASPYGMPPPQAGPYPAAAFGQAPQQQQQVPQMQQQPQQLSMGGVPPVSAPPQSLGYGGAAPDVVLSPTNPFASAAGGAPAGANPFSAAPPPGAAAAGSNVEQEWNAFFTRGQAANQ